MSFYTDWFIADEGDAKSLAASQSPFTEWPSLSLPNIGEIDLMNLWALLQNKSLSESGAVSESLLHEDAKQGLFVVRVASTFVAALSQIPDTNQKEIALAWSQSEEFADNPLPDPLATLSQIVLLPVNRVKSTNPSSPYSPSKFESLYRTAGGHWNPLMGSTVFARECFARLVGTWLAVSAKGSPCEVA